MFHRPSSFSYDIDTIGEGRGKQGNDASYKQKFKKMMKKKKAFANLLQEVSPIQPNKPPTPKTTFVPYGLSRRLAKKFLSLTYATFTLCFC